MLHANSQPHNCGIQNPKRGGIRPLLVAQPTELTCCVFHILCVKRASKFPEACKSSAFASTISMRHRILPVPCHGKHTAFGSDEATLVVYDVADQDNRSPRNMASREHGSVRGAYVQPAADESIIRCALMDQKAWVAHECFTDRGRIHQLPRLLLRSNDRKCRCCSQHWASGF